MMKSSLYNIPLTGLKEGSHLYEFEVDDDFFEQFEESEISKGSFKIVTTLVKRSAHMELFMNINGSAELICDRCVEVYLQRVETSCKLIIKFGDQWDEVDDEILMIPHGESNLNLTQLFYEYIHLGLPIKRVHPEEDGGDGGCDPEMLKRIYGIEKNNEWIDPRWKDLNKINKELLN